MKSIVEYLNEHMEQVDEARIAELEAKMNEASETIKSEKDLRAAMEAKFKEVFGDDLDEEKMNKTIDGFCKDHEQEIKDGKFGELIGEFNESFAPKGNGNEK